MQIHMMSYDTIHSVMALFVGVPTISRAWNPTLEHFSCWSLLALSRKTISLSAFKELPQETESERLNFFSE